MKKFLSILLVVVMLLSMVGCNGTDSQESATTEVKQGETEVAKQTTTVQKTPQKVVVWCWDMTFNGKAMQLAEEIYKVSNANFTLEIVDMAKMDLEQKLNTSLAAGVKEGLPDIILVNDPNAQKYVSAYPNTFADLTNSIDYSNFSDYKVAVATVEGKTYGVPFDIGVTGLYYRRDYLEQAGFQPSDLENITWDEYIEIGEVVKEKTGKYMCTINPNDEAKYAIMLQSAGSWFITADNKGNFVGNDIMTKAIETYKKLADSGIAKPVTSWSEFVGSFNAGDTASIISGVWQIASIKDAADQSGKWGVAPTPRLDIAGAKNASNEGGSCWFVLKDSQNQDIAIDFLAKTFGGSSELYDAFLNECGGVGSFKPAFVSDTYSQKDAFFGEQQIYSLFTKWSTEVPSISMGLYTAEAKDALKNEIPDILNGADIKERLERVQALYEQQVQ